VTPILVKELRSRYLDGANSLLTKLRSQIDIQGDDTTNSFYIPLQNIVTDNVSEFNLNLL